MQTWWNARKKTRHRETETEQRNDTVNQRIDYSIANEVTVDLLGHREMHACRASIFSVAPGSIVPSHVCHPSFQSDISARRWCWGGAAARGCRAPAEKDADRAACKWRSTTDERENNRMLAAVFNLAHANPPVGSYAETTCLRKSQEVKKWT